MRSLTPFTWFVTLTGCQPFFLILLLFVTGCRSAAWHKTKADDAAQANITQAQQNVLGYTEDMQIQSPENALRIKLLQSQKLSGSMPPQTTNGIPELPDPLVLTPTSALHVAARNSRAFQESKESVFSTALGLDFEKSEFRTTFATDAQANITEDRSAEDTVSAATASIPLDASRRFKNGISWTGSLAVDLVKLLTQSSASSLGIIADTSISIPLLRGAGRDIAAEPLRQAEQDMLYAIMEFESFKRSLAFDTFSGYLDVLQAASQIKNAEQNYESLTKSRERAKRLTEAGRLPAFQYDQTVQDELRARNRWIEAKEQYASQLDQFKFDLGLPPDARIELDDTILTELVDSLLNEDYAESLPSTEIAVRTALENRLDLQIAQMRVTDAERKISVAQDALRAEFTMGASIQTGESRSVATADKENANLDFDRSRVAGLLNIDLALDRRRERLQYRRSLISLESARRDAQEQEDRIKLEVRDAIRRLHQAREELQIQQQAATLADQRVHSTDMFLEAGRAQIRDVLEAREARVNARNALIRAAVNYRVAQLRYQRDTELLKMTMDGVMKELFFAPQAQTMRSALQPHQE